MVSDAVAEFADVAVIVAVVVEDTGVVVTGNIALLWPADTLFADVAVIVAVVVDDTGVVVTGNIALLWPACTITDGGTPAAGLLLDKLTGMPPDGAGALNVTVPVALCPPVTAGGEIVKPMIVPVGGPPPPAVIVRSADTLFADVAVIVAVVVEDTGVVVTGKFAVD
jgi:hypothetical protein